MGYGLASQGRDAVLLQGVPRPLRQGIPTPTHTEARRPRTAGPGLRGPPHSPGLPLPLLPHQCPGCHLAVQIPQGGTTGPWGPVELQLKSCGHDALWADRRGGCSSRCSGGTRVAGVRDTPATTDLSGEDVKALTVAPDSVVPSPKIPSPRTCLG